MSKNSIPRPVFPKRAVVTGGMPYGNKELHFGHIGGVFVHADVFARFLRDRIGHQNVIFVSGTDCYGSPIVEYHRRKVEEGSFEGDLKDFVLKNHAHQKMTLENYQVAPNLFAMSAFGDSGKVHEEMSAHFFNTLLKHGHLTKLSTLQFYDEKAEAFLNGRQVIGQCPIMGCQSERGYADECSLGHQYQPHELVNPISALTNSKPLLKEIENWYIEVETVRDALDNWLKHCEDSRMLRKFALSDIKEFFAPPIVHVHKKHEEDFESIAALLPPFTKIESKGKSFQLEFANLSDREIACDQLSQASIQYRNGKTLVPFRLTGNIEWGVPVPNHPELTFWVWPESLWAPISFTSTYLQSLGQNSDAWKDWWCSKDAMVYQFIGEDNVYFYGPAQTALFAGMQGSKPDGNPEQGQLQHSELIVNKHLLFLNSKASSSGNIKPPMAADLLKEYTADQLRAHFLSLGLGMKNISFAPKSYNPEAQEKDADPVLKESQLLSNVLNRLVRSALNSVFKCTDGFIPVGKVSDEVIEDCESTILMFERSMASKNLHQTLGSAEKLIRKANKHWSKESQSIDWRNPGPESHQPLIDIFHYVRCVLVLMHPIVPKGTESVLEYLQLPADFWNWEHIFEDVYFFMKDPQSHQLRELPPHTDFF